MRSSRSPNTALTNATESNRYAFPARLWKVCTPRRHHQTAFPPSTMQPFKKVACFGAGPPTCRRAPAERPNSTRGTPPRDGWGRSAYENSSLRSCATNLLWGHGGRGVPCSWSLAGMHAKPCLGTELLLHAGARAQAISSAQLKLLKRQGLLSSCIVPHGTTSKPLGITEPVRSY